MAQIKIGFVKLNIPEKLQRVTLIVSRMTGNANFTTPDPTLAELTAAETALQTAYERAEAARQEAKRLTRVQEAAEKALDKLISLLASYVQLASRGDANEILTSGFELKSEGTDSKLPPAPSSFSLSRGDLPGQVHGHFDSMGEGYSYTARYSSGENPGGPTSEQLVRISNFDIEGLASGSRIWVEISATNPAGEGPFTSPISLIVP